MAIKKKKIAKSKTKKKKIKLVKSSRKKTKTKKKVKLKKSATKIRSKKSRKNNKLINKKTKFFQICKENEISYLAVANMDVGLPEKDPNTGLTRVYVAVTAKVSDLTKRFPKTVASISGKPYAGLGSNPEVAKRNALNTAAEKSAKVLVDLLRAKGVR